MAPKFPLSFSLCRLYNLLTIQSQLSLLPSLATAYFSHLCYCGKWLVLFHSKCWYFTNSSLENYNLNYTRQLQKPKSFKFSQTTGSFSQVCPCTFGQWSWAEQNIEFSRRVWSPRQINPRKIWLRWVSRAVLKAKRSQSRSDSSQRDLGWGRGGPDSPALPQGGIKKPSLRRTSGYLSQSHWVNADESHGLHPENPEPPNMVPHIAASEGRWRKCLKKTQWLPGGIEGFGGGGRRTCHLESSVMWLRTMASRLSEVCLFFPKQTESAHLTNPKYKTAHIQNESAAQSIWSWLYPSLSKRRVLA